MGCSCGRPRAWLCWSGGKDSAMAYWFEQNLRQVEITKFLVTVCTDYDRVTMHGIRTELVSAQAKATGIDVVTVEVPAECSNEDYQQRMRNVLELAEAEGVQYTVFGDLYLEDVRAYRESMLARTRLKARFPLWQKDPRELAKEFVTSGFSALVCCVDTEKLPASFLGLNYDEEFLSRLPGDVDPCGERGEFHTCVVEAPFYSRPLPVKKGVQYNAGRFAYLDLLLDIGAV